MSAHKFFSLVLMRAPGDLVWSSHCKLCDPLNITIKNKIIVIVVLHFIYIVFIFLRFAVTSAEHSLDLCVQFEWKSYTALHVFNLKW